MSGAVERQPVCRARDEDLLMKADFARKTSCTLPSRRETLALFASAGAAAFAPFGSARGATRTGAPARGATETAIPSVLKTYEAALNANDIDTILGLYGSEPVFMPQHAPALVGRDAVRAAISRCSRRSSLTSVSTSTKSWQRAIGPGRALARRAAPASSPRAATSPRVTTSCSCFDARTANGKSIATCSPPTSRAPDEHRQ
jgi:hypothetical protein